MERPSPIIPIIRTKLYPPPIARDFVNRQALDDRLEEGVYLPLTLVSAPAGYGKSTLVSHWLGARDGLSAWLSLDEADNDLRTFVSYVVAAVQTIFPDACRETLVQLNAPAPLSLADVTVCLSNDLDNVNEPFVLALDDYHRINEPAVHDLLSHLLEHRPRPLHLVIISRCDPLLPLATLRAHHMVNEIRLRDLQFTEGETAAFLEQATGRTFSDSTLAQVHVHIEGWAVGLRLAVLALQHQEDVDAFLRGFRGDSHQVQEYLLNDVLSRQPSNMRDWLRKTSILDRFCAPLCEAVCMPQDAVAGLTFIQFLATSGMLCLSLDEHQQWYRYHHLFRELLHQQLKAHVAPNEIAGLHQRAASWFEAQGLLEEAIHHTLNGDDAAAAARLMVRHRNEIINGEQWHRLDQWLQRLPTQVVERDPELLVLHAWHLQNRGCYPEAYATLDRIEALIDGGIQVLRGAEQLRGSVDALRSHQRYVEGHGDLAINHAEQAIKRLPQDCLGERAYAIIHRSGALQMCGRFEEGQNVIYDLLSDTTVPLGTYQSRLLMTLCFMDWVAAELPALQRVANQCVELGKKFGLEETMAVGFYFLSIFHYQRNELSEAEAMLMPITVSKGAPNLEYLTESVFILASVQQANGQADKARETVQTLSESLLSLRNTDLLQLAEAYEADLALRQGRLSEAMTWARRFDPGPFEAQVKFYEPRLTLAKVLVTEGSGQSVERAASLLARLEAFYAGIHNIRFLIEALALQAILSDAKGDRSTARDILGRAVTLAQPGGMIRLFVDLGPRLATLLNGLDLNDEGQRFVGRILAACRSDGESKAGVARYHFLTKRELEVLGVLADGLSRKEIAERLCISSATVKRHTENIYGKLGVSSRRQAVAKAQELAILRDRRRGNAVS